MRLSYAQEKMCADAKVVNVSTRSTTISSGRPDSKRRTHGTTSMPSLTEPGLLGGRGEGLVKCLYATCAAGMLVT